MTALHRTSTGHGWRTVLVHGFTQTLASWEPVLDCLASPMFRPGSGPAPMVLGDQHVRVDLPGHGGSADVRADLWQTADLLADVLGPSSGQWVGYSLGGRCCLHLALAHPEKVTSMVLVGATAGIDDPDERAARRARDEALADRIEQVGVAAFLDEWLAQPLFAGLTEETAGREARLVNTAAGLAASLRLAGTGTQEPLWDRLAEVGRPVLLVAGERDERFVGHAERMAGLLPHAEVAVIPGAGHAAHLEDPVAFVTAWHDWQQRAFGAT